MGRRKRWIINKRRRRDYNSVAKDQEKWKHLIDGDLKATFSCAIGTAFDHHEGLSCPNCDAPSLIEHDEFTCLAFDEDGLYETCEHCKLRTLKSTWLRCVVDYFKEQCLVAEQALSRQLLAEEAAYKKQAFLNPAPAPAE